MANNASSAPPTASTQASQGLEAVAACAKGALKPTCQPNSGMNNRFGPGAAWAKATEPLN